MDIGGLRKLFGKRIFSGPMTRVDYLAGNDAGAACAKESLSALAESLERYSSISFHEASRSAGRMGAKLPFELREQVVEMLCAGIAQDELP